MLRTMLSYYICFFLLLKRCKSNEFLIKTNVWEDFFYWNSAFFLLECMIFVEMVTFVSLIL